MPLLDIAVENERLAKVREEADFEREWAKRRPEFAHLWDGNGDGFITNMGRYALCRQRVRNGMQRSGKI